jgi:hypothetical protein
VRFRDSTDDCQAQACPPSGGLLAEERIKGVFERCLPEPQTVIPNPKRPSAIERGD